MVAVAIVQSILACRDAFNVTSLCGKGFPQSASKSKCLSVSSALYVNSVSVPAKQTSRGFSSRQSVGFGKRQSLSISMSKRLVGFGSVVNQ
jgi:hypothetical protein